MVLELQLGLPDHESFKADPAAEPLHADFGLGVLLLLVSSVFAVVSASEVAVPPVHVDLPDARLSKAAFFFFENIRMLFLRDHVLNAALKVEHHVAGVPLELLSVDFDCGDVPVYLGSEITD